MVNRKRPKFLLPIADGLINVVVYCIIAMLQPGILVLELLLRS